jgi:hypothetical protein
VYRANIGHRRTRNTLFGIFASRAAALMLGMLAVLIVLLATASPKYPKGKEC